MKTVDIYTDGACSGNPGPGGYCAILIFGERELVVSGYNNDTTNNRMELLAVIEGVKRLKQPCAVRIFSDSSYVVNAFTERWIGSWQLKGWKNVKNTDLWQQLLEVLAPHKAEFIKVKGHSGNELNNRCDKIAREQRDVASNANIADGLPAQAEHLPAEAPANSSKNDRLMHKSMPKTPSATPLEAQANSSKND